MCKKLDFPFSSLGGPRHGARVWCLGRVPKHRNQWQEVEGLLFSPQNFLVSRPSAKAKEPLARSRGQWQEVGGLLFSPQNSKLVHILSFHSYAVVSLFIFPTGPTALNPKPRGRRYVKNTGHNRNRLYSRAIHCPASMEKYYVQWFILKSV